MQSLAGKDASRKPARTFASATYLQMQLLKGRGNNSPLTNQFLAVTFQYPTGGIITDNETSRGQRFFEGENTEL